jgi:mannose-1-phosphate guanylyltransferase
MADRRLYPVIMAGGSGTRLWPYSTRQAPKQLRRLVGDRTMLQATADRVLAMAPPENVFVLANREQVAEVRAQLPEVPPRQVVGEPEGLGTAPAVGLGGALVAARDPDGILACFSADHVVSPVDGFVRTVRAAATAAERGHVVVIGVPPSSPDTGLGYIEVGDGLPDCPAHAVRSFREKPDAATAEEYVTAGRFLWNAGMFIWSVATLFAEYGRYLPALAERLATLRGAADTPDFPARLADVWPTITDRTSIDYGILERSRAVACVTADFEWHDVGNWSALADVLPLDGNGNTLGGDLVAVDTHDCVVFDGEDGAIATLGVSNLVIVRSGNKVLVCARDRAQEVRAIVDLLRAEGRDDLL